jgi:hypothetical protein
VQAPSAFDLPCPWAPLQSVATAASRHSHCGFPARRGFHRARRTEPSGPLSKRKMPLACAPVILAYHPKVLGRVSSAVRGLPRWHRSRDARDVLSTLSRPLAEASGRSVASGSLISCRTSRRPKPSPGGARALGVIRRARSQLVTSFTSSSAEASDSVRPPSGLALFFDDGNRHLGLRHLSLRGCPRDWLGRSRVVPFGRSRVWGAFHLAEAVWLARHFPKVASRRRSPR